MRTAPESLLLTLASLALVASSAEAQTCPATWTVPTLTGDIISTPFGPFPSVPIGFTAGTWDHDGDPSTPLHALVGGSFAELGGVTIANIASLDPGAPDWSPIGAGLPFGVSAVAGRPDGTLVAGGYATDLVTPIPVSGLAEWDGAQWNSLPAPVTSELSNIQPVEDIALEPGGGFVIGGQFDSVDGVAADSVARWDGQGWSALGGGLDGGVRRVVSLGGGELLAGVFFPSSGPAASSGLARWNGSTWAPAFVGASTQSFSITDFEIAADGTLYASGGFVFPSTGGFDRVARWNGQDWEPLGAGFDGTVDGAAVTRLALLPDGGLLATGVFALNGTSGLTRAAVFDGTTWSPIDAGLPFTGPADQLLGSAALPTGEIVVAGGFGPSSGLLPIVGRGVAVRTPGCPATTAAFGPSGTGPAGTNALTAVTPPFLGGELALGASGFAATSLLVPLVGFAAQDVPLPLLTPAGDPGSSLLVVPDAAFSFGLANDAGTAALALPVPAAPSLIGAQVFTQVLEAAVGPAGITSVSTTNAIAATIGAL